MIPASNASCYTFCFYHFYQDSVHDDHLYKIGMHLDMHSLCLIEIMMLGCSYYKLTLINLLLTEREGRTGEYWPEIVTVRTEHRKVHTKTTEGQYSPIRLEQARLVSSLLYGTRFMLHIFLSNVFPVS